MCKNKANGPGGIPAEILKIGGAHLHYHIPTLIMNIWDKDEIPSDHRDALIVIPFKNRKNADCEYYRGITPLSITGKESHCPHSLQEIPLPIRGDPP